MGRPKAKMTKRWQMVMDFLKAYQKIHGVSPSYEVMTRGLGMVSRSNVHRIVKRLEEEGLVQTKPRKYLSVKLVDRSVKEIESL